jgi:hypothetical protein
MVRDRAFWEAWEAHYIASQPPDFPRNLQLLEGMYELARTMGVFPLANPLEGLETDIRVAKALNVSTASGNYRPES